MEKNDSEFWNTNRERQAEHYRTALAINRLLKRIEKDGAAGVDEEYALRDMRNALNALIQTVEPLEVTFKRSFE